MNNSGRKIRIVVLLAAVAVILLAVVFFVSQILDPGAPKQEPVEIKTVKTESFEMDYFSFGTGEKPLVILPGASLTSVMQSADAVAAAYSGFAEEYTVYLFDIRRDVPEVYPVKAMAEDTAKAMEALGITNADLFGCSLGGMIAQCIAMEHPELVHKMVLASTLARQNETSRAQCGGWGELARSGDVVALNRGMFGAIYSPEYYAQYREIFASMETAGTEEELRNFSVIMDACSSFDVYDELSRISCPVLVMGSWDDQALSWEGSVELASALHCSLYMYSGYGHAVYDEAPDFKARIMAFLAE